MNPLKLWNWMTARTAVKTKIAEQNTSQPSHLGALLLEPFMVIEGFSVRYDRAAQVLEFTAGMRIDNDGDGGNAEGDKFHQPETSYRLPGGKSLNPYKVPFIVIPLVLVHAVKPAVLGSRCVITYMGKELESFVGDLGGSDPKTKKPRLGEASVRAAEMLGIPSNPKTGGVRSGVTYRVYLGKPSAPIGGLTYKPRFWN